VSPEQVMGANAPLSRSTLSNLTFSAQNCNSINISTNCPKQMKKIAAILELQTIFIFLSDLRLNSEQTGNNDKLFLPHYKLYHNSKSSKRGVGILVSSKLHYDVISVYNDAHDNILGLKLLVGTEIILLISI
jgi:hypothetical protein